MGSLSQTVTVSAAAVNLTTVGTVDWANWDGTLNALTATDFKSGAGHTIPDPTILVGGSPTLYTGDPRTLNWTNGTNTGTSSSSAGVYNNGNATGDGFQLVLPADTNVRTVNVYIGGFNLTTAATITATLSDGSAGPVTDSTTFTGSVSSSTDAVIALVYQANSSAQTLTLKWAISAGSANVTIQGVAYVSVVAAGTALTGQGATSTAGTLVQSRALAATGQSATSTAGTVGVNHSQALTGQGATSTAGTLTQSRTLALTGQAATFTPGTISASTGGNLTLGLTGQAATFTAGTMGLNVSFALTGQAASSATGTLTQATALAITGQSATFTAGTILPSTTVALNGQGATFSTGTISVSAGGNVTLGLTGQAFTATPGTLTASTALALLGQSATFSAGNLTPQAQLALSGQGATFNAGTITITGGDLTLALNGQGATFTAGTLTASGGTIVVTNTGAGRRVHSIYRITIDGVVFECRTYKEAIALLEKAKAPASILAEDRAIWAVTKSKPLELPKIEAKSPELQAAVIETRKEISTIYERELANVELKMLLELSQRASDDDETLLLLM